MNYEIFYDLFKNFADFLPKEINIESIEYEMKKNWRVYEEYFKDHEKTNINEKIISLLYVDNFN